MGFRVSGGQPSLNRAFPKTRGSVYLGFFGVSSGLFRISVRRLGVRFFGLILVQVCFVEGSLPRLLSCRLLL